MRYSITVDIPEGETPNLVIHDPLPLGLTFLDDGTATYRANTGSLSSSTAGDLSDEDTPLTDLQVGPDGDVFFNFGDITNTDLVNSITEQIIIEFNAIADNSVAESNDAGETRSNQAEAFSDIVSLQPPRS